MVCAGLGEIVPRSLASFVAVEKLRSGASPQQAADGGPPHRPEEKPDVAACHVGILVLDFAGRSGPDAIQPGVTYAGRDALEDRVLPAPVPG